MQNNSKRFNLTELVFRLRLKHVYSVQHLTSQLGRFLTDNNPLKNTTLIFMYVIVIMINVNAPLFFFWNKQNINLKRK